MRNFIDIVKTVLFEDNVVSFPKKKAASPKPFRDENKDAFNDLIRMVAKNHKPTQDNRKEVQNRKCIEILFPGPADGKFDRWLNDTFEVEGSGNGPDGRDVWIYVDGGNLEITVSKIKREARKYGINPADVTWREIDAS